MNNLELNKIYCESNLETMSRMPDGFVDYVMTIPPYNVGDNKMFGKENDIWYDPYMGTGTTAVAAIEEKRNWIGSEISSEYVELANKRLYSYLNQQTLF